MDLIAVGASVCKAWKNWAPSMRCNAGSLFSRGSARGDWGPSGRSCGSSPTIRVAGVRGPPRLWASELWLFRCRPHALTQSQTQGSSHSRGARAMRGILYGLLRNGPDGLGHSRWEAHGSMASDPWPRPAAFAFPLGEIGARCVCRRDWPCGMGGPLEIRCANRGVLPSSSSQDPCREFARLLRCCLLVRSTEGPLTKDGSVRSTYDEQPTRPRQMDPGHAGVPGGG